ncbi:TIGR02269 family lipoprotein [Myxococcus stipitatus]|uniref:SitA6 family polymorphic toxin lipoprotein n=1 Tax=Myxococcus stipitatus TaxID=83455 RepID=UPI001F167660|nr:TIGR02269 family lipoprotein [Myxococcus stipitatus]MCE9674096.1 TIGR02269 family lipoprotein [Myxococcus stipitatus]
MRWTWLLLTAAAALSCATVPLTDDHDDTECDDPEADRCLMPACVGEVCGLYICEDLVAASPSVVRARFPGAPVRPPIANPQRNWGAPLAGPAPQPVLVIHWYRPEQLPSQVEAEQQAKEWARRPKERHHIFPQAFRGYFRGRGINVHDWTLWMALDEHQYLHRLPYRGPWNTEWDEWIRSTKGQATKAANYERASYMVQRYNLFGIPMTYWQAAPSLQPYQRQ